MTKILFLDQYSELGGAQRCLLELTAAVRNAGWEPCAALPAEGPLNNLLRARGIPVYTLPIHEYSQGSKGIADGVRFLGDLGALAARIRALVRTLDVALLYVNGPRLMPAMALARTGRPVVFHTHSYIPSRYSRLLVSLAIGQTDATLIAASRFAAGQWSRPANVVYGGVEGPTQHMQRTPNGGPARIGLMGRFSPLKCQKEFVQAAAELERAQTHAEFLLYGDALFGDRKTTLYKEDVLASAPASLRYLGWCDDVYSALSKLDLLVVPSHSEGGIPLVILEAFAAKVPVLASPVGDVGEAITEGRTGFLLPSPSAPSIARRIQELLADRPRLDAVSEDAHRMWRQRFTAERYRSEIRAILQAVLGGSPAHRN